MKYNKVALLPLQILEFGKEKTGPGSLVRIVKRIEIWWIYMEMEAKVEHL